MAKKNWRLKCTIEYVIKPDKDNESTAIMKGKDEMVIENDSLTKSEFLKEKQVLTKKKLQEMTTNFYGIRGALTGTVFEVLSVSSKIEEKK